MILSILEHMDARFAVLKINDQKQENEVPNKFHFTRFVNRLLANFFLNI